MPRVKKLTAKEEKFVEAIALGKGTTEAALEAGYSPKCPAEIGAENLTKPRIQTALEKRKAYYRSLADVKGKDIIGAYQEMAFASIEDALDDNGNLDFAKAKKNGSAKLIKKISRQQTKYGETVAVEFYSRTDALNQLTDVLGIKKQPGLNPNDADVIATVLSKLKSSGYDDEKIAAFTKANFPELATEVVS